MPRIYLSLGSNVEPERNLRLAVAKLRERFGALDISPVYRNKAVGFAGDDFLNLVVGCETDDTIDSIVESIESIHRLAGRERGKERFSSRPLDIDLLTYGDTIADDPVRLPRDDILRYSFVLMPLVDIAPDEIHPGTGRTFGDHWRDFDVASHAMYETDTDFE